MDKLWRGLNVGTSGIVPRCLMLFVFESKTFSLPGNRETGFILY